MTNTSRAKQGKINMFGIPTCKEVFEKQQHLDSLSTFQKIRVKAHLFICKNCQHYHDSLELMQKTMINSLKSDEKVNQDVIDQIKNNVKTQIKKDKDREDL